MVQTCAVLGFPEAFLDGGAVAEPGFQADVVAVVGGDVGDDEAGCPDVVEAAVEGERELVRRDGPAAPGARVGTELLRGDLDPAHDRVRGPALRGVVARRDLPAVHVPGVLPVADRDRRDRPPGSGVALRSDREVSPGLDGRAGEGGVEVAGVRAHPGPAADLRRQHRERPAQQLGSDGSDVVVAGGKVHRQRQLGLCPAGQVHPAAADPGVVPADALLGSAVDLDVIGVQVDGRMAGHQRRPDRAGDQRQPAPIHPGQACLDATQAVVSEAAREPSRRGARRDRGLAQQHAADVGADPVKPGQAVLPKQLRAGHPDQQLPTTETSGALLDRPDPGVELGHQTESRGHLIDCDEPRHPGHGRVRRADSYATLAVLGRPLLPPYAAHPAGALQSSRESCLRKPDSPCLTGHLLVQHAIIRTLTPTLLADVGQKRLAGAGLGTLSWAPSPEPAHCFAGATRSARAVSARASSRMRPANRCRRGSPSIWP